MSLNLLIGPGASAPVAQRAPVAITVHPSADVVVAQSHTRVPFMNISDAYLTTIDLDYVHWTYSGSLEFASYTGTLSVRAGIEYLGVITPAFNAGNRDVTIVSADSHKRLTAVLPTPVPPGGIFYVRTRGIVSGGDGKMVRSYTQGSTLNGGTIQAWTGIVDGSDYTTAGTQPTTAGAGYGPFSISSVAVGLAADNFMIFGDSIEKGNVSGLSDCEYGILATGRTFINYAVSGSQLQSNTNPAKRIAAGLAAGCTHAFVGFPVNDLKTGARSVAQCQASYTSLWTNLKAAGVSKIWQRTCYPYTNDATDPGTIMATPTGAFTGGASSFRSLLNAWHRTGYTKGTATTPDFVWDGTPAVESALDSGLWLNPTINTSDGLHPSFTGSGLLCGSLYQAFKTAGY